MARIALSVVCSLLLIGQSVPALAASSSTPELKFKVYAPSGGSSSSSSKPAPAPVSEDKGDGGFWTDAPPSASQQTPVPSGEAPDISTDGSAADIGGSSAEASAPASSPPPAKLEPAAKSKTAKSKTPKTTAKKPAASAPTPGSIAPAIETPAADNSAAAPVIETPAVPAVDTAVAPDASPSVDAAAEAPVDTSATDNDKRQIGLKTEMPTEEQPTSTAVETPAADTTASETTTPTGNKVLQGYIRVVPTGTKIPIIMDTAVDSDTSQEGDEFAARTSEDLTIDGSTVVPAGSVIKGRIAALNAPRALMRSGSVALKFDTVTTPDNRQIPLVANIVAKGGVVHARRGMKDIAIDTGTIALPTLLGLGIGAIAGNASGNTDSDGNKSGGIGLAGGALIGAGVGIAIGVVVLCAKKGKKIDVRPGDELKIELAEDLRMPIASN